MLLGVMIRANDAGPQLAASLLMFLQEVFVNECNRCVRGRLTNEHDIDCPYNTLDFEDKSKTPTKSETSLTHANRMMQMQIGRI